MVKKYTPKSNREIRLIRMKNAKMASKVTGESMLTWFRRYTRWAK